MDHVRLYETIFKRKSIRKYKSELLDQSTIEEVCSFISTLTPMIPGIKTNIRTLGSDDVKGMFKSGAPHFLAIYSEQKEGCAANAGFLLQQMDLYFSASGIGSCWHMLSKPLEKDDPVSGLEFVISLAFGKPAEDLQRRSVSEFKRRPLSEITDIKGLDELLEPARLAPSGVNNQSWYFRGDSRSIDAYYQKSRMTDQMNQINVGIALCHIWLAALHVGKSVDFVVDGKRENGAPKGYRYAISLKTK